MIARCNPFRSERIEAIQYRDPDNPRLMSPFITEKGILQHLAELNYRAAIVGPDGSGKTTLLEAIAAELASEGFSVRMLFLNTDSWHGGVPSAQHEIVLFDGADLLEQKQWESFLETTAGGLIITTHLEGMLPTLVKCSTNLRLLEEIVNELTGSAQDFPLEKLYQQRNGNLRDVLRALYDICAAENYLSLGS